MALVAADADVNAHFTGPHAETPLHWAASSDDVAVLEALIAVGADLDAEGSVIDGGAPLADAVAFGQWNAARRLVEDDLTPLDAAVRSDARELGRWLRSLGAKSARAPARRET